MTNQEIINTGQTIANETHIGGNTAARVGGVIEGIGENLESVNEVLNGNNGYIDLSQYTTGQYFIDSDKWFVNAYYLGKLIPCIGGDTYTISNVGGTKTAIYAFTRDNNVVAGNSVNYATGSVRTNVLAGNTTEVVAPSDAAYLWIATQNGAGNNNTPTSIYHQGQSNGLVQNVQSLTDDVQGLNNSVDELERDLSDVQGTLYGSGESGYIDLSDYATGQNYINAGKWFVNAQYLGKLIPCIGGDTYIISNADGTKTAMYTFTKDNNVVANEAVNYATGYGSPNTNVLAGATAEVVAPSDAAYLWICTQNGAGNNNTPTSIYHQGQSNGLVQSVQSLTTNVQDIDESVNAIEGDLSDVQKILNGSSEGGYIDLTQYSSQQAYIYQEKWFVNAQYLGKIIPCVGGDSYTFSNAEGVNTSGYSFLKSNNVVSGQDVDFATGYSGAFVSVLAGVTTAPIIAPSDANYIWVMTQNGANKPCEMASIYHQPQGGGLIGDVEDLNDRVDELSTTQIITTVRQFPNNDLPVISFCFDDIVDNDEQIVSLFDEYGLTCGFAFIASTDKIAAYKDKYLAWQRRGYSILNHSIDNNPINTTTCPTINDAYAKVATAKSRLEKAGFVVNGWVSPSSTFPVSNPDYSDVLKNLMAYGYVGSSTNTRSDNPCLLSRLSLQTTLLSDILDTNANNQSSIAFHVAVNRQLTFFGHAADLGNTYNGEVFSIAKIRSVIERCIELRDTGKLAILNPDDMCRYFFR